MKKDYFHEDIQLFLEHRVDWERLLRLRSTDTPNVEEELTTYRSILATLGDVCEDIAEDARDHWHEEARLEDGVAMGFPTSSTWPTWRCFPAPTQAS
jgi:hypothetical protein